MRLKYLFSVEYTDGTTYQQTPEDISKLEPNTRSEYFDVINSGKKVKTFTLKEQSLLRPKWLSVDLTTGEFTHSKNVEPMFEGDPVPHSDSKFELIFYRQHQHDVDTQSNKETDHRITYFLGWQTNIEGKNYKQIMGVK